LLAEREAFKRRAMAVPTIENKKKKVEKDSPKKPAPSKPSSSKPPISAEQRKAMGASSQYKASSELLKLLI